MGLQECYFRRFLRGLEDATQSHGPIAKTSHLPQEIAQQQMRGFTCASPFTSPIFLKTPARYCA